MKFIYTKISNTEFKFISDVIETDRTWKEFKTLINNCLNWKKLTLGEVIKNNKSYTNLNYVYDELLPDTYSRYAWYIKYRQSSDDRIMIKIYNSEKQTEEVCLFQLLEE